MWDAATLDINQALTSSGTASVTIRTPLDISVMSEIRLHSSVVSSGYVHLIATSLYRAVEAAVSANEQADGIRTPAGGHDGHAEVEVLTNLSSQVRFQWTSSSSGEYAHIYTLGWTY